MAFHIRDASASDELQLHAIHLAATMSSYGRQLSWLEPILADPATPLEAADWTVVADDGALLGYAAVTRSHIENLFVAPSAQGRGVGSALLAEVESRLLGRFDAVTLRCLCVNPDARRLYDRSGYLVREVQTIELHGRPLEAWLMAKPLG
jgi:ribosomal protein S18 acetylase RimI-like enzyme